MQFAQFVLEGAVVCFLFYSFVIHIHKTSLRCQWRDASGRKLMQTYHEHVYLSELKMLS